MGGATVEGPLFGPALRVRRVVAPMAEARLRSHGASSQGLLFCSGQGALLEACSGPQEARLLGGDQGGQIRHVWATDESSVEILLCFLADGLWSRAALRRSRKVYVSDSRRRGRVSRARSLFRARRSLETCSDLQEIGIHHSDPEHQGGHVLRCVYLVLHESVTMRRRRGLPRLGDSEAHHCSRDSGTPRLGTRNASRGPVGRAGDISP